MGAALTYNVDTRAGVQGCGDSTVHRVVALLR